MTTRREVLGTAAALLGAAVPVVAAEEAHAVPVLPKDRFPAVYDPDHQEWLREVEARLKAARPGPWQWSPSELGPTLHGPGTGKWAEIEDIVLIPHVCDACAERGGRCMGPNEGDAEFIAHSREDVQRLLCEVRNLREIIADYRDHTAATLMAPSCEGDLGGSAVDPKQLARLRPEIFEHYLAHLREAYETARKAGV